MAPASLQGSPAEQGGGMVRPAGCGRYAHNSEFQFGECRVPAADLRAAPPGCRAGPSHVPPLDGSAAFFPDGGVSTQPTLAVALDLPHGGGSGGHFFQFSRNQELAGQDARDATDALPSVLLCGLPHVFKHEVSSVQGVGKGFQDG